MIEGLAGEEREIRERTERGTRIDQPLRVLPALAGVIESELEHARGMYAILSQARPEPQVLDDATLARVKRQFREQLDHVADDESQLARWRERMKLSTSQCAEVNRLAGDLEALRAVTRRVLDLADELAHGTIGALLRMDDAELGLTTLLACRSELGPRPGEVCVEARPWGQDELELPSHSGQMIDHCRP